MSAADRRFESLGGRTVYEGRIVTLRLERFRFRDGEEVEREIVRHQGAVGVLVHDDADLYLVRQPREAVGDPDFLEIGKAATTWEPIKDYVSSVGVMDEVVHLFHATGLTDAYAESESNERIEIVRWPLADLDGAIDATRDAKTLIALLWLKSGRAGR